MAPWHPDGEITERLIAGGERIMFHLDSLLSRHAHEGGRASVPQEHFQQIRLDINFFDNITYFFTNAEILVEYDRKGILSKGMSLNDVAYVRKTTQLPPEIIEEIYDKLQQTPGLKAKFDLCFDRMEALRNECMRMDGSFLRDDMAAYEKFVHDVAATPCVDMNFFDLLERYEGLERMTPDEFLTRNKMPPRDDVPLPPGLH